jgi:hypothetical protein
MRKPRLRRRQRQILFLMREADGPTLFPGGTRGFSWARVKPDHPGALVIYAYQEPERFMETRGLVKRVDMNATGRWYRLTEEGAALAEGIEEMPA